jgi:hypothetical protein
MKTKNNEQNHYAKTSAIRHVIYIQSVAITSCDCGKTLIMAQTVYGDSTYKGKCKCGKIMNLKNGKISQLL